MGTKERTGHTTAEQHTQGRLGDVPKADAALSVGTQALVSMPEPLRKWQPHTRAHRGSLLAWQPVTPARGQAEAARPPSAPEPCKYPSYMLAS